MAATKQSQLKTFMWLVKREYWQNRGLFLWAPAAISGVFFLMFLYVEFVGKNVLSGEHWEWMKKTFGDEEARNMVLNYTRINVTDMSRFILQISLLISALFSSFYLFGSLSDERKDRSILFWKSLPVSDTLEVLSKLVFPLLLSPLLTLLIATAGYLLAALTVACATTFAPNNLFEVILYNESLYQLPLRYLSLLPFYIAWSLPCVAWFILVSSWTKSRVFPWAIGLPMVLAIVVAFTSLQISPKTNSALFIKYVLLRVVGGNLPGSWILQVPPERLVQLAPNLTEGLFSDGTLIASAKYCVHDNSLLVGVVAGIVMIILAIRRRRYSDVLA